MVEVPLITQDLLRKKYSDLKKGRDNLNYITEMIEYEKNKKEHQHYLKTKYDYAAKAIVAADAEVRLRSPAPPRKERRSGHQTVQELRRQTARNR